MIEGDRNENNSGIITGHSSHIENVGKKVDQEIHYNITIQIGSETPPALIERILNFIRPGQIETSASGVLAGGVLSRIHCSRCDNREHSEVIE